MYLAYSSLRHPQKHKRVTARHQGYLNACQKHRETIEAIRQYLPGWKPAPPVI